MNTDEYAQFDAVALAELVRAREVTPSELVAAALERIDRFNPMLNAVVERRDRSVMTEAAHVHAGPLAGVPFLVRTWTACSAANPTRRRRGRWWIGGRRSIPSCSPASAVPDC